MVAIFVVLTILICVSIDALIQRKQTQAASVSNPKMPEQARLYPGHTWASVAGPGKINIGMDDFIASLLGPIDRMILQPVGSKLVQGDPMATIELGSRTLHLRAPISGTIQETNHQLWQQTDPLETQHKTASNWIYNIQPTRIQNEWQKLKMGQAAQDWLQTEWQKLSDWLTDGPTFRTEYAMQDGGLPAPGLLQHLNCEEWQAFQQAFLDTPQGGV